MAGPNPPNHVVGADGPREMPPYPKSEPYQPQALEFPDEPGGDAAAPPAGGSAPPPANYPGRLPPMARPRRRPKQLLIGILAAITLVAGLTAAIVYGVRTNGANTGGTFSEGAAKTAIQGYLNALVRRDVDVIVRNALCGIYDGVKDKRSDQALAKLSSDAFRKQFSQANVTSIDKIVYWSQYQAQVLFSMQVTPATGGPPKGEVQGVAQLLFQRGQILVCSYVLRTAGQY
ncbi:hypothetical protein H7H78_05575 [Mycobacterium shinjukuense]|uniref:DUF8174 domain-containing protein n=1 Tax=Mycobacterium shinjukuense TaxID=398694 RepID=A0A7I7MNU2_9MYCO|nr:hypothetical protein [Mycobacterium shinjukuense]MCV6984931.1 hypothetical protein [Mycobacterium shinjukuense]ORB70363.1 hypothetical protein BST45_06215 [Mycobacterium shinjukuense]BBX73163.1 hypothetical protein MSHI_10690 [Mycobacterium shinjukuense]